MDIHKELHSSERFLIVCLLGYNKTVLYWVSLHYVDEFLNDFTGHFFRYVGCFEMDSWR